MKKQRIRVIDNVYYIVRDVGGVQKAAKMAVENGQPVRDETGLILDSRQWAAKKAAVTKAAQRKKKPYSESEQVALVCQSYANLGQIGDQAVIAQVLAVAMDVRALDYIKGPVHPYVQLVVARKDPEYMKRLQAKCDVCEEAAISQINRDVSSALLFPQTEAIKVATITKLKKEIRKLSYGEIRRKKRISACLMMFDRFEDQFLEEEKEELLSCAIHNWHRDPSQKRSPLVAKLLSPEFVHDNFDSRDFEWQDDWLAAFYAHSTDARVRTYLRFKHPDIIAELDNRGTEREAA